MQKFKLCRIEQAVDKLKTIKLNRKFRRMHHMQLLKYNILKCIQSYTNSFLYFLGRFRILGYKRRSPRKDSNEYKVIHECAYIHAYISFFMINPWPCMLVANLESCCKSRYDRELAFVMEVRKHLTKKIWIKMTIIRKCEVY